MSDEARLDELDKEEFWEVARTLKPGYTREQYDIDWDEFVAMKREHLRRRGMN